MRINARLIIHNGEESEADDGLAPIFPIIDMRDSVWIPVATGFFISTNGLFATAKHVVIDDCGQPHRSLAAVQIDRRAGRVIVRSVIYLAAHAVADVAIGLLTDQQFRESGVSPTNASPLRQRSRRLERRSRPLRSQRASLEQGTTERSS
jgi:hypothetical protein